MFSFHQHFLLRIISITGQMLVLLFAIYGLHMELAVTPFAVIIGAYFLVNAISWWRYKQRGEVSESQYFLQLSLDVLALDGLLYLSGGATNPFVSLLLLPLVISATTLSRKSAWIMAACVLISYSVLMVFFIELPTIHSDHASPFHVHVLGMWFSFMFSVSLIILFVIKMAETLRKRDAALAHAQANELQNQHIIALGTFAAGAAHELGTPLSTMAVIANELKTSSSTDKDVIAQATILREQIDRCKRLLTQITAQAGDIRAESGRQQKLTAFLTEVIEEWKFFRPRTPLKLTGKTQGEGPDIISDVTLKQAVTNLLNNAADASPEKIEVSYDWDAKMWRLAITDFGKGIDHLNKDAFAQPVYSTKPDGHGLGLFLANAVIKRFGGELSLVNNTQHGGACATVTLPLPELEEGS